LRKREAVLEKFNYISSLDNSKIKLYTLQLANMKRIEANDAVYIFDEVGAGKTISAGLSTIQLLFHQQDKRAFRNILVITAPSVTEQFQSKWENILGLKVGESGYYNDKEYNIEIINYDYRNIAKAQGEYDFIIVDEAHEFLNPDTERYKKLIELKAKKIMFMTATPIKYSRKDLECYPRIASEIIVEEFRKLTPLLLNACKDKTALSGGFDPELPVTRYFKETVRNIEKTEDGKEFTNKEPRRLVPKLWEYDGNVNIFLGNMIEENLNAGNRFVVFVNYIRDTDSIANALREKGFSEYAENYEGAKTYCIIIGKTFNRKELLRRFSTDDKEAKLPDVLIMTHKIAEQGIDLPCYNYVVNYHISAAPSKLEQRFGRIDRLNSVYGELNTCFLIKKNNFHEDTNTANFYMAVLTYMNEFLPLLPTKNCLITLKVLERIEYNNDSIISYYGRLLEYCNDQKVLKNVYEELLGNFEHNNEKCGWMIDSKAYTLLWFCKDKNIEFSDDIERLKKRMTVQIMNCIAQSKKGKERIKWWKANIDMLSGDLFFINTEDAEVDWSKKYDIETINPKEVAKGIVDLKEYKIFSERFKKPIEVMSAWNECMLSNELEEYFEKLFHNNAFNFIFPRDGSYNFVLKSDDFLQPYINELIQQLPFFKMCQAYRNIVRKLAYTDNGFLYQRYDFNPFKSSLRQLFSKNEDLEISKEFFERYDIKSEQFYINEKNEIAKSSNWLKLFYKYSRIEEFAVGQFRDMRNLNFPDAYKAISIGEEGYFIKNTYYALDGIYRNIKELKGKIRRLEKHKGMECSEFRGLKNELQKWEEDRGMVRWGRSLFHHFRYPLSQNKGGQLRSYTFNSPLCTGNFRSAKGFDNEITQHIINDL